MIISTWQNIRLIKSINKSNDQEFLLYEKSNYLHSKDEKINLYNKFSIKILQFYNIKKKKSFSNLFTNLCLRSFIVN